jgi:hypothetical protein
MSTQAQAEQNQTTESQSTQESLGAFKTSRALTMLYGHAAPFLSDAELEHLAGATFQAEIEAANMAELTEALGCVIASDKETGSFDDLTPTLLFQISNNYDLLSGLIQVGRDADFRLSNPEKAYPPRKQPDNGGNTNAAA